MPDILIRGVEFPTMEQAYKTLIVSYDGKVYEGVHPQPTAKKKEPIAEAVELPPHGELIDRDALLEIGSDLWVVYDEGSGVDEAFGFSNEVILNAPVVVPEERRESGE